MATALKQQLESVSLLEDISLPQTIDTLLSSLEIVDTIDADHGNVQLGIESHPLFLDLSLTPGGPKFTFAIQHLADGFSLTLDLSTVAPASSVLSFITDIATAGLKAADKQTGQPGEKWLTPRSDPKVVLNGVGFALMIEGHRGQSATLRFSPSPGQPAGIIPLTLDPPTVMLGDTGFGLELPIGLLIDDSEVIAPSVAATIDGKPVTLAGDDVAWRGISVRNARFYLPESIPLFGKTAVDAQVEIGLSPPGLSLSIEAKAPAREGRPEMDVRIECIDPSATGLASFAPTLVEASITVPQASLSQSVDNSPLNFLAGEPVTIRARFSRDPSDPEQVTRLAIAVESQGDAGIVQIDGHDGVTARSAIAAAAFATALVADGRIERSSMPGGHQGGTLEKLVIAGTVLSSVLNDKGKLTVHAVELDSSGHGLPVGGPLVFLVDYSVDVAIKPLAVGSLSIGLDPEQPLRIRMRGVALTFDPSQAGLSKFNLDFDHATMEVEDPGRWLIDGPDSLFDVLGSRSGRGSVWVEIDLRFKLDLGPIKVNGATIRGTMGDDGSVSASLRGLDVTLSMPGLISAEGKLQLNSPSGFSASLDANIIPLHTRADAFINVQPPMILIGLGIDLPGPLPLASSGLGLYGIGGTFGIAAALKIDEDPSKDLVTQQLAWTPEDGFVPKAGDFSIGLQAVVGTLPDFAFTFGAKGGLFLTVPDFAMRGALDAQMMSGPPSIGASPSEGGSGPEFSLRGAFSIVPSVATSFALLGEFSIPVLLKATIPLAGYFPTGSNDWYVYLGADGYAAQGRSGGPTRLVVLPDIFPQKADAYLMLRGNGIEKWPRGDLGSLTLPDGFIIAFGFSVELSFGPKPIAWAEVTGGADIMIATHPLILAGFGRIDGSLHIGPASIGVGAQLTAYLAADQSYVKAKVCGRIHLLFVKVEKCATLSFGDKANAEIPWPNVLPTDQVTQDENGTSVVTGDNAVLLDDHYRRIGSLSRDPNRIDTVWPDTLIGLTFATPPDLVGGFASQFPTIDGTVPATVPIGSAFLKYRWILKQVRLVDVTDAADRLDPAQGDEVPGPMSAAWQLGKVADSGAVAQPAELVLLTPQQDLWIDRLDDAGASLPSDPLGTLGSSCHVTVRAKIGWTLGGMAVPGPMDWWLPPEFVSADPTQSRIEGRMMFIADGRDPVPKLLDGLLFDLPGNLDYVPPATAAAEVKVDRAFVSGLALPYVKQAFTIGTKPSSLAFQALVLLDDVLVEAGEIYVLYNGRIAGVPLASSNIKIPFEVRDEKSPWPLETKALEDGRIVLIFRMPNDHKTATIRLRWTASMQFVLLGVGGTTLTAVEAATARETQAKAQADANAAAAAAKIPTDSTPSSATRCMLAPGRHYRVDVAFAWTAERYEQDENGKPKLVDQTPGEMTQYAPEGFTSGASDAPEATRQFFFATTPDPHLSPASSGGSGGGGLSAVRASQIPLFGDPSRLSYLFKKQDVFAPEMLERHLAGYEPAQTEVDRFRDDPLRAHFDVSHVAALADAYGYKLSVTCRRVDTPGPEGEPIIPVQALIGPTNTAFQKGAALAHTLLAKPTAPSPVAPVPHPLLGDRVKAPIKFQQPSDCPIPQIGMTIDAPVELAPRAWYEVYIAAAHKDLPTAALPGVTFRTSRWKDVPEMMTALAFPTTGPGKPTGDLAIVGGLPPIASGIGDGSFEAALDALGFEGWPLTSAPRTSLLWLPQEGAEWLLAGVLIESPEPIERAGRCLVSGIGAQLAPTHTPVSFTTRVQDRTASRLLFLTATPFVPNSWTTTSGPIFRSPTPGVKTSASPSAAIKTLGGISIGKRPISHAPQLVLSITDKPMTVPPADVLRTGTLVLPSQPSFAAEAF